MSYRSFYSSDIKSFIEEPTASILSSLVTTSQYIYTYFKIQLYNLLRHGLLSPFRMVCRDFILTESANRVFSTDDSGSDVKNDLSRSFNNAQIATGCPSPNLTEGNAKYAAIKGLYDQYNNFPMRPLGWLSPKQALFSFPDVVTHH